MVAVVLVTLPLVGVGAGPTTSTLLRTVSEPITTPTTSRPARSPTRRASRPARRPVIQWLVVAATLAVVVVAARVLTAEASFMVAVVASQLISPILWDHYAIVLLLPVAWLMSRGPLVGRG